MNKSLNSQCPTFININSSQYKIVGLVEIMILSDNCNHYRAHCFINNEWKIKDGLSGTSIHQNLSDSIKVSLIVYAKFS